jgi:hypothetical protein
MPPSQRRTTRRLARIAPSGSVLPLAGFRRSTADCLRMRQGRFCSAKVRRSIEVQIGRVLGAWRTTSTIVLSGEMRGRLNPQPSLAPDYGICSAFLTVALSSQTLRSENLSD